MADRYRYRSGCGGAGLRAISHYFVKIAMDRKCPGKVQENISMVSVGSVNEELLKLTEQATKELESAAQTRVEVESHDGLRLVGLHFGLYAAAANDLCKKRISIGSQDCSTVDAFKQCKVPVLFIHGADDNFVPVRMTHENYAACASEKYLLIVPGADHAMSYCVEKKHYQMATIGFWSQFDSAVTACRI